MKRFLFIAAVLLCLVSVSSAAITNTLSGRRPTSYWWTSATSPADRAMQWAIEVETLLAATAGTNTASKALIVGADRRLDQFRLTPTDTTPTSPTEGTVYHDDSEGTLKVYDGAAWAALGAGTFTGGNITSDVTLNADGIDILADTTTAHTYAVRGYDVDGEAYADVLRWTNGNTVATVVGSATGSLSIVSTGLNVTTAGAMTGVTNLTATAATITTATITNLAVSDLPGNTLTIGDASSDTLTITSSIIADMTLDDGTGASPSLILKDATDETATFSKADGGFISLDTVAGDGFAVTTGNFKVGNGTPGVAQDGEDAYVEGTFEVDGASQFDGDIAINDQILVTLGANDEEVLITSSVTNYTADSAIATITASGAGATNNTYLLRLRNTANADAQDHFLVVEDNAGDDKLAVNSGGTTTWTLDAGSSLSVDGATTASTTTAGVLGISLASATTTGKGLYVDVTSTIGAGEISDAVNINLDDDTAGAGSIRGIYIASDDSTGSSVLYGLVTANSLDSAIYSTMGAAATWATVDAATTDSTLTTGVLDIDWDSVTNNAEAVNIKATQLTGGAGVSNAAIEVELDSDSGNAGDILYGLIINATDTTATGKIKGLYVKGAGIDAGIQLDTGYLRVGTGSTPAQSIGDDDVYIEGILEIDGAIYADGGIIGDGGDVLGGFLKTVTNDADGKTLTVAESGTVQTNVGAVAAAAWTLPGAVAGLEYTLVVMAAQELRITPAAGDAINIAGVQGAAAEYWTANAVGEALHLVAVDATNWIAISYTGTWTQETP